MNFTLHITSDCNFNCGYCPQKHQPQYMDFEIIKSAIKISMDKGMVTGFCFYGGEPLLNFSLIEKTIEYAKKIKDRTGHEFRFKLNTNGSLLTDDILQFLTEHDVGIGFSHDGLMQSTCRKYANGEDSFETANEKARLLLQYQPDASVQTTVAPICVGEFANSVEWLLTLGFQNILTTPA